MRFSCAHWDEETAAYAGRLPPVSGVRVYGTDVLYPRLIEIGNICRNDCLYCGIRRPTTHADRYRLTEDESSNGACEGYTLGFPPLSCRAARTARSRRRFHLPHGTPHQRKFPDCAVTLSLGNFRGKITRPCLPPAQTAICCGMRQRTGRTMKAASGGNVVRKPYALSARPEGHRLPDRLRLYGRLAVQTPETLAEDLKFIETFRPAMCGIGPFIPRRTHPLATDPRERREQTVYLPSLLRLMQPKLLLPATTALGTILPDGRERGLAARARCRHAQSLAAFRAKKIRTLRRQAVHRRGGGAVHRLPVAACAVGRREYRHRPRRRKIVKSVPNKKGYNINGCL